MSWSEEIKSLLDESQQAIYLQFKEAISDLEINANAADDFTFVRFLRAREFNLGDSVTMFRNYI